MPNENAPDNVDGRPDSLAEWDRGLLPAGWSRVNVV
jgi:hypothetical protein